jgi:hypothetical protein
MEAMAMARRTLRNDGEKTEPWGIRMKHRQGNVAYLERRNWRHKVKGPITFQSRREARRFAEVCRVLYPEHYADAVKVLARWTFLIVLAVMAGVASAGPVVERFSGGAVSDSEGQGHVLMPPMGGAAPAKGAAVDRGDGLTLRRLTDVSESGSAVARAWDGNPGMGWTNGYSTYSAVNSSGTLALAIGSKAGMATLVRLRDAVNLGGIVTGLDGSTGLGESAGPRWDRSGRPGWENVIWFDGTQGNRTWLAWVDALTGRFERVIYGGAALDMDDHADQAGRWRPMTSETEGAVLVVDTIEGRVLPVRLPRAGNSVSLSGRWLQAGARIHPMADLERGTTDTWRAHPAPRHGHECWARTADGRDAYVAMDNSNDWYFFYTPDSDKRVNIFHMSEIGWATNYHVAAAAPGWVLFSTYSLERAAERWAANQLFLVELAPASERPRIVRLGSTENRFLRGTKGNSYFTEAFASMDPEGRAVYWGANWDGSDNLELYELALGAGWDGSGVAPAGDEGDEAGEEPGEDLEPVVTPEPTPESTATPEPVETPGAEWQGWEIRGRIEIRKSGT